MFDLPIELKEPEPPEREVLKEHYRKLFPEYKWSLHEDCLKLAKESCWLWDDFVTKKQPRWLSILGQTGTGKTEWAKRLKDAAKPYGISQMWHWSDVCDKYLADRDYGILRHMERVDFLVIDEIGLKEWASANRDLSALLNRRLGKWTVITSNLTQGELADIDARVASRLVRLNNRLITMSPECPDYSQMLYKESL